MRILTINTHSLCEKDYESKLDIFVGAIADMRPNIIAMQEVNQTSDSPVASLGAGFDVRCDNHALRAAELLRDNNAEYRYYWYGIKKAYGSLEEGIAFLTDRPPSATDKFIISRCSTPGNWKTRAALGIRVGEDWFYSIHTGRCDDDEEPFGKQWERFYKKIRAKKNVWVMGDFNITPNSVGYDSVLRSGFYDTFRNAGVRGDGMTVHGRIDGWEDMTDAEMRIDYIFTDKERTIKESRTVFDGKNYGKISDHCGVLVDY